MLWKETRKPRPPKVPAKARKSNLPRHKKPLLSKQKPPWVTPCYLTIRKTRERSSNDAMVDAFSSFASQWTTSTFMPSVSTSVKASAPNVTQMWKYCLPFQFKFWVVDIQHNLNKCEQTDTISLFWYSGNFQSEWGISNSLKTWSLRDLICWSLENCPALENWKMGGRWFSAPHSGW